MPWRAEAPELLAKGIVARQLRFGWIIPNSAVAHPGLITSMAPSFHADISEESMMESFGDIDQSPSRSDWESFDASPLCRMTSKDSRRTGQIMAL